MGNGWKRDSPAWITKECLATAAPLPCAPVTECARHLTGNPARDFCERAWALGMRILPVIDDDDHRQSS